MSPGLTPRPSLSDDAAEGCAEADHVSPGLTPRPSLSDDHPSRHRPARPGVAGANAPAFVERDMAPRTSASSGRVSPGLTPRPSLSVLHAVQ